MEQTTFNQQDNSEPIAELVVQLREARKILSIEDMAQVVARTMEDDLEIEALQKAINNITLL
jgi:hypothetical protein